MPDTLDEIRNASEAEMAAALQKLDSRHRDILRAAMKEHGRVQDIPESVWEQIRNETEEEIAALLLLLIIAADDWTTGEITRQGAQAVTIRADQLSGYSLDAARRAREMAAGTTDTLRDRLARKSEDQRISGPGKLGNLTQRGIDNALSDTFTKDRRETIATDQTTSGISAGQRGAKARAGDGASTADGQSVDIVLYWVTERDDSVCPRCSPLHDQPEDVWSRVFPNGPGPEAHPNCRCSLSPRVIVTAKEQAA